MRRARRAMRTAGALALAVVLAACSSLERGRARDPGAAGDVAGEATDEGPPLDSGGEPDVDAQADETASACDDGNPCTVEHPADGGCAYLPMPDGSPCGDARVCLESACVPACGSAPCARGLGLFDGCRCAVHPTGLGRDQCASDGAGIPCTGLPAEDPGAAQDGATDGRALISRALGNGEALDLYSGLRWRYAGEGTLAEAVAACGGDGWRLPAIEELAAWLDLGAAACPSWDPLVWRSCPEGEFRLWSSTPLPWDPGSFYTMAPTGPSSLPGPRGLVACVYGAARPIPDPDRYLALDDRVLLDPQTGLAWDAKSACESCDWADALATCAGRPGDWRLPSLKELLTIQNFAGAVPQVEDRFPVPDCAAPGCDFLWTGTPWFEGGATRGVLALRPATGTAEAVEPSTLRSARCVRTVPGGRPAPAFEARANALVAGDQVTLPARSGLAALSDGAFVLAWENRDGPGEAATVRVRRFNPRGIPMDAVEVDPDPAGAGPRQRPVVAPLEGGSFVVAWDDGGPSGGAVRARAFGPDGRPSSAVADLAADPAGTRARVALAALSDGGFAAAWESGCAPEDGPGCVPPSGRGWGVQVRRFGPGLVPEGEVLPLSRASAGEQFQPSLAPLDGGRVVAVWVAQTDGVRRGFYRLLDPGTGEGTPDLEIEPV